MGKIRYRPRRTAYFTFRATLASQVIQLTLYNDSTGPDYLAFIYSSNTVATGNMIINVGTGQPGGSGARGLMVMPNQAQISGLVYTATPAAPPAFQAATVNFSYFPVNLQPGYPLIILPPNYFLQLAGDTVNSSVNMISIWWMSLHEEDVDGIPCPICDRLELMALE